MPGAQLLICPNCGHFDTVTAFGSPEKCPACEAYYHKALALQARRSSAEPTVSIKDILAERMSTSLGKLTGVAKPSAALPAVTRGADHEQRHARAPARARTSPPQPTYPEPADTIATLCIRYQSGAGEITERVVSATDYTPYDLSGLCHLRGQHRTFNLDRILDCTDIATGEVVTDTHAHLRTIYMKSSRYSLQRLTDPEFPVLDILLYVGKADGQLRAPERKVIAAACKVFTHDLRITQDQVDDLLGYTPVPSLHSFKIAVGRINKLRDEVIKRKLLAASRTIIATQKNVSPGEQEALDYMVKRFAKDE